MNIKNVILAIALLIATVVVAIVNTDCVCCNDYLHTLTWHFWGLMIVVIIADWGASCIKHHYQEQKEKEIAEIKNSYEIKISIIESTKKQSDDRVSTLETKLLSFVHTKYADIEGFFEWYKLKVLADKDYIKKSFSNVSAEYDDFKEKLK